jgi:predicted  nucleic acid-binding Zn-ribbon protein
MEELKNELDALKHKVQGNGKVEGSLEFRVIMLEASHRNIENEVKELKGTMRTSIKELEGAIDHRMNKFESLVSRIGWTVVLAVLGAVISSVLI